MAVNINCDMGESFSLYKMGEDEAIMPYVTEANVACGFHGSDPNHMRSTVELAKSHNVKVGAHFSLPDLAGFGRREMKIERAEMANIVIYQIGALKAFLDMSGVKLNHLKPHGALYGMAARDEHIAHAISDAAEFYDVPIFGLSGTLHEEIYTQRGLKFRAEFFADLDYDDAGNLLITREHHAVDADDVSAKALRAVTDGIVVSLNGKEVPVKAETICIHSDTPGVLKTAKALWAALEDHLEIN
ncbi:5-oxoprolinase subunit PxpA [Sneathiella marina]|uniref:5-oxoprolinase subunit PxpA n=1 Tax=Sneathiella marina TaxID=2950108 RepID=A0ABY4W6Q1_9PROT|nr:5-oxoprolinase subunit PxpA [Sneathiella marina]USG61592.1 5-oxoprolinase subunit PxpA [Sneathiella marina]